MAAFAWQLTRDQARMMHLLEYVVDDPETFVRVGPFYAENVDRSDQAREDLEHLKDRGAVSVSGGMGAGLSSSARVLPIGRATIDELRPAREDKSARQAACRSLIVAWLFDQDVVPDGSMMNLAKFIEDEQQNFWGSTFQPDEVYRAAGWLVRNGLATGDHLEELDGPANVMLTDEGTRCVERCGADVKEYLDDKERGSVGGATFNVNGRIVQFNAGDNSSQVMTIGSTIDSIADALGGLMSLMVSVGVGGEDAEREQALRAAVEDLRADAPSAAGIRRAGQWVRGRLALAGNAQINAALLTLMTALEHDAENLAHAVGI
jgi:hypothetical protein